MLHRFPDQMYIYGRTMGANVEKSDFADKYSAEGLGSIVGLLVLCAVMQISSPYKGCITYCDNLGFIWHTRKPNKALPEKQSQGDIINLTKQYIMELDFDIPYHHVYAYLDEVLRWDQMTDIQKLNVECDMLAKEALLNVIVGGEFIPSRFLFEQIVMNCGEKVMGPHTSEIYRWWGYNIVRAVFHSKNFASKLHFDLIY